MVRHGLAVDELLLSKAQSQADEDGRHLLGVPLEWRRAEVLDASGYRLAECGAQCPTPLDVRAAALRVANRLRPVLVLDQQELALPAQKLTEERAGLRCHVLLGRR